MPDNRFSNDNNNEDLTIDFGQLLYIIWHHKYTILACYIVIISLTIIITLFLPKKYEASAKLLINKSSSTNLSEINPFVLTEISKGGALTSSLLGGISSSGLDDDIQIIKSPLVLEKVIKENNLKYLTGPKEGQYLDVDDFLNKSIDIENKKGTNILNISYKSSDPKVAYQIVKSIINNYKSFTEELNVSKASKDRAFLEDYYNKSKQNFNKKTDEIKAFKLQKEENLQNKAPEPTNIYEALLSRYDKRLSSEYKKYPESIVENKKIELEVEQETEKLNKLRERFEWSILVEQMARNANKVVVLHPPKLLKDYENTEPNLIINIIISLVASFTVASLTVFSMEKLNKKITFIDLHDKAEVIKGSSEIDFSNLDIIANKEDLKEINIVSLAENQYYEMFKEQFQKYFNSDLLKINQATTEFNDLKDHILNIKSSETIIFVLQIEHTQRKEYGYLLKLAQNLNKNVLVSYFMEPK